MLYSIVPTENTPITFYPCNRPGEAIPTYLGRVVQNIAFKKALKFQIDNAKLKNVRQD